MPRRVFWDREPKVTMNNPYSFRIMGCLPGHTPVEFFRSKQPFNQSYWRFVTADLDLLWHLWLEKPTRNKETIAGRPRIYRRFKQLNHD